MLFYRRNLTDRFPRLIRLFLAFPFITSLESAHMLTPKTICAAVVLLALLLATPAMATDQLDLSVGLKTLPLLNDKLSGSAVMAVIYDPANAESKSEADDVKTLIDAGLEVPGGVKITSLLVSTSDLAKLSGTKLAFVTKGGCTAAAGAAATSSGILTMSTDIDCVRAGKCILGVVSKPSVEIYYSKAASDAAKIGFSQAFSMLVKQV